MIILLSYMYPIYVIIIIAMNNNVIAMTIILLSAKHSHMHG